MEPEEPDLGDELQAAYGQGEDETPGEDEDERSGRDRAQDPPVEGLGDRAWSLFDETLYSTPNIANRSGFLAPVVDDEAGNHFPRAIYWQRGLMAFNPLANWTDQFVTAAYQSFLAWFDRVLLEEPEMP